MMMSTPGGTASPQSKYKYYYAGYVYSFRIIVGMLISPIPNTRALIRPVDVEMDSCEKLDETDDGASCAMGSRCRITEYTGRRIKWVACDSCDGWYHVFCIGLKRVPKSYCCVGCV